MTHAFVAIGDAHLQSSSPRQGDRLRALDQIVTEGRARPDLAAWLWLGDVFHGRSTPEDRNAVAARLQLMAAAAPVVVTYGNHEAPGDLDVFARLAAPWPITVVATPQVVSVVTATQQPASVFVLPYPSRGALVAAGAGRDELYDAGQLALEAVCRDAGQELAERRAHGHLTLVMGHVNVSGARSSVGQPQVGREIEATTAMLDLLGDIPVVLGHIHLPQAIGRAVYAGSITAQDFGEIEAKRYLVVTLDGDGGHAITSRPLDTPRLYHIEGELTRDGFTGRVLAGPGGEPQEAPETWAGCEVRVRYRFKQSERALLDDQVVAAGFRSAARVHLAPVAIPDRGLRAPQVAVARTLAEKLAAWAEANGEVLPLSVAEKLAALEHDEGSALLTAVATHLRALEPLAPTEAVPT